VYFEAFLTAEKDFMQWINTGIRFNFLVTAIRNARDHGSPLLSGKASNNKCLVKALYKSVVTTA